jgi:hypothetical protein
MPVTDSERLDAIRQRLDSIRKDLLFFRLLAIAAVLLWLGHLIGGR